MVECNDTLTDETLIVLWEDIVPPILPLSFASECPYDRMTFYNDRAFMIATDGGADSQDLVGPPYENITEPDILGGSGLSHIGISIRLNIAL